MLFNVSGLLRDAVGAVRRHVLEPEPPVRRGTVVLVRTPQGVLVQAAADVVMEATCSRCLAPFGYPAQISFEETFHQQVDVATGARLPFDGDAESFVVGPNHTIDISEAVRQYSEMAAEMQPLCRPDCPGLCPGCGRDLTIEVCTCNDSPVDPRWAKLLSVRRANG